jgi:hypothetical protein
VREERDPELRKAFDDFMRVPFPRDSSDEALSDVHADLILYDAAVASCVDRLLGYHRQFDPSLLDDDRDLEQRVRAILDQGNPVARAEAEVYQAYLQVLNHLVEMCRERVPPPGESWLRTEE